MAIRRLLGGLTPAKNDQGISLGFPFPNLVCFRLVQMPGRAMRPISSGARRVFVDVLCGRVCFFSPWFPPPGHGDLQISRKSQETARRKLHTCVRFEWGFAKLPTGPQPRTV